MDQDAAQGVVYLMIALYFLPTIVALLRGHLSLFAIILLNVVFGWTLIGWFVAMLWALTSNTKVNRQIATFGRPQNTLGDVAAAFGGAIKRSMKDQ